MKTLADFIDQYGVNGWKMGGSGAYAPMVMMLRAEIATPGSTWLSSLDRVALEVAFKGLKNIPDDDRNLANGSLPFVSLRIDASQVEPAKFNGDFAALQAQMDINFKKDASIIFVHGEKDNPFIQHSDTISKTGVVTKDVSVGTDLNALKEYYNGALSSAALGWDLFATNKVVTSKEILQNMLELVLQYGIDTPEHMKSVFGSYAYAPGVVDAVLQQETKLPAYAQLNDPASDALIKGYLSYFGRPADPGGLQYWVDAINRTGGDATAMIDNFGNSSEYRSMYGNSSSSEVVNSLYQHLFNRDAEKAGLDFWAHHLDTGALTLANIAFSVVNAAQNSDATIITEKVEASRYFTANLDTQRELDLYSNNLSALNARKWLSLISDNDANNTKLINLTVDVINKLQGDVEPILIGQGFDPIYY
jgi:hypothetical protein